MIQTLGDKLSMSHGLGQKAKSVAKKAGKVALGTVGVLGAIGAVAGFDQPGAKMVRQRGGFERMIRGGNR
tara:strand:- start:3530 stop:3739 length:210 start_codon:yes stop_codon:yes gene_type:complete